MAADSAWPQFHHDAGRSGLAPRSFQMPLTPAWSVPLSTLGFAHASPAIYNHTVYVVYWSTEGGNVVALDLAKGTQRWRTTLNDARYDSSGPALAYGKLYVASVTVDRNDQPSTITLFALDPATGTVLWRDDEPTQWDFRLETTLAVAANTVFWSSSGGGQMVYATNATTGESIWTHPLSFETAQGPTYSDGLVYVGDQYGSLVALDADSGGLAWSVNIGAGDSIISAPTVADGLVFVGGEEGDFHAYNASDGAPVWNVSGPVEYIGGMSSPTVAGGVVFVVNGSTSALDARTGAVMWSNPRYGTGILGSSPAFNNGTLFVAPGGNVSALDAATGALVQSLPMGDSVGSSPAVGDGYLVVEGTNSVRAYSFAAPGSGVATTVTVTPGTATLAPGDTLTLAAVVTDRYGDAVPGATVTWSASAGLGVISAVGVLSASTTAGTGTVSATYGSLSGSANITVAPGPLHSLTVDPGNLALAPGDVASLRVTAFDAYGNARSGDTYSWRSTIGTLQPSADGLTATFIAGDRVGNGTITVESSGKSASIPVSVAGEGVAPSPVAPSPAAPNVAALPAWVGGLVLAAVVVAVLVATSTFLIQRRRNARQHAPDAESRTRRGD